jgi:hypothetical protein
VRWFPQTPTAAQLDAAPALAAESAGAGQPATAAPGEPQRR